MKSMVYFASKHCSANYYRYHHKTNTLIRNTSICDICTIICLHRCRKIIIKISREFYVTTLDQNFNNR